MASVLERRVISSNPGVENSASSRGRRGVGVCLTLGLALGFALVSDLGAALAACVQPLNLAAMGNTALLAVGVLVFTLSVGVPLGTGDIALPSIM